MRYASLNDVPIVKLRKWLAWAVSEFGTDSQTAKIYRREIQRRARQSGKGVRHVRK